MSNPHYDAILAQIDAALSGPASGAGISYNYAPGRSVTMAQDCEDTRAIWIADYEENLLRIRRWYRDGKTTEQLVDTAANAIRNGSSFVTAPCR